MSNMYFMTDSLVCCFSSGFLALQHDDERFSPESTGDSKKLSAGSSEVLPLG